jgi:hypothetical protein
VPPKFCLASARMPPSRTSDRPPQTSNRLPRTSDLSMSMVVLGLLVERSDTLGGIGVRLDRQFPDALWSRSALPNGMKGLLRKNHARLIAKGGRPRQDRYEATDSGAAYFHAWKRESAPPRMLRDALQGKLTFSTRADLPGLIETTRAELGNCEQKYADAHKRLRSAAPRSPGSGGGSAGYDAMVSSALLADQVNVWGFEIRRLRDLLKDLEEIHAEFPGLLPGLEAAGG